MSRDFKRFRFNLIWYLGVVIVGDVLPILIFFGMHAGGSNTAPLITAMAVFFVVIAAQSFLHLHLLGKRSPDEERRNTWNTMIVTFLAVLTFPALITALVLWSLSRPV